MARAVRKDVQPRCRLHEPGQHEDLSFPLLGPLWCQCYRGHHSLTRKNNPKAASRKSNRKLNLIVLELLFLSSHQPKKPSSSKPCPRRCQLVPRGRPRPNQRLGCFVCQRCSQSSRDVATPQEHDYQRHRCEELVGCQLALLKCNRECISIRCIFEPFSRFLIVQY